MLGRLLNKKDGAQHISAARRLYANALTQTRESVFYTQYGVPDTFDGRFDLLLLHIFLTLSPIMDEPEYKDLSQALFDVTFKDMDQTLREMGVGDVGIPKHMKRMMTAFNGRMHSYQIAIAPERLAALDIEGLEPTTLEDALARNLYGTISDEADWDKGYVEGMVAYITKSMALNSKDNHVKDILRGNVTFLNVQAEKKVG